MNSLFAAAVLAVLAGVVSFGGGPQRHQEQESTTTELMKFQNSDGPKTLRDLIPDPVPPRENAAWWLERAATGRWAIDLALAEAFDFDVPCDRAFVKRFDEAVASHPDTYGLIFRGAEAGSFVPSVNYDVDSFAKLDEQLRALQIRSVARVLMYRSAVELAKGRHDESAMAALAILKLASNENMHYGFAGFMSQMTLQSMGLPNLNRVLQSGGKLSPETMAAIRKVLDRLDSLDGFQKCFDTERVVGIQLLKEQGAVLAVTRVEGYLKLMRLAQENANQPICERAELVTAGQATGVTAAMVMPGISSARQSAHRNLTMVRCLRLLVELQTQMQDEPDLSKINLPGNAKTDPVSGEMLVVKKVDRGWLIYGVGINGVDDGGDVEIVTDYGIQPFPKSNHRAK